MSVPHFWVTFFCADFMSSLSGLFLGHQKASDLSPVILVGPVYKDQSCPETLKHGAQSSGKSLGYALQSLCPVGRVRDAGGACVTCQGTSSTLLLIRQLRSWKGGFSKKNYCIIERIKWNPCPGLAKQLCPYTPDCPGLFSSVQIPYGFLILRKPA